MAKGAFNLYHQDTNPGANSTFAPPYGWTGDQQEYVQLMLHLYRNNLQIRQQMETLARRLLAKQFMESEATYSGPYAETAQGIVQTLVQKHKRAAEKAAHDDKVKASA